MAGDEAGNALAALEAHKQSMAGSRWPSALVLLIAAARKYGEG